MQFEEVINSKLTNESDRPLMQKEAFPVSSRLQYYLQENGRDISLPVSYTDLLYYSHASSLRDKKGKLTHWEMAIYEPKVLIRLNRLLLQTYAALKCQDYQEVSRESIIKQVDFCEFGNSVPFRISVFNHIAGYEDYYYIKLADASRIYGLELEHLLSPNSTNFLYHHNTLVEEHIEGVPGDTFLKQYNEGNTVSRSFAKEFVQFNERCFARLLGDMRSYNFVVNMEEENKQTFKIRAIDFDQQSYEGKKSLYLPQFYKENYRFVEMVLKTLDSKEIKQYQEEERTELKARVAFNQARLTALLNAMIKDELSENYKILILRKELNEHFQTTAFANCTTMGAIVKAQLKQVLLSK
jgi:hypothetical protein